MTTGTRSILNKLRSNQMERMTTDNPNNNCKRLLNYCKVDNDRQVVLGYAGGKYNIKLHKYAADCCQKHGCTNMTSDKVLEDGLMDCYECPIAIMYYCGVQAAENNARLAAYEDTGLEPEEIKSNEQIIADLTRAVCLKYEKIKKLKELLKKATSIEGFIDYHYDEIEEALKDENRAIQR